MYIIVHKGDPLDYQKYRHTAIWLVPAEGDSQYYCHVRGAPGEFEYEKRTDYDPRGSRSFAKLIEVGRTKIDATTNEITGQVKTTPVCGLTTLLRGCIELAISLRSSMTMGRTV